jgi:hypothetical protein
MGLTLIDSDLDAIAALGANIVRIGEYAWDRMEPREGSTTFVFRRGDRARKAARPFRSVGFRRRPCRRGSIWNTRPSRPSARTDVGAAFADGEAAASTARSIERNART